MSKVIKNPSNSSFRKFELEVFGEDETASSKKKEELKKLEKEFKHDYEGKREHEFVMGGFDFEYEGGYRSDEIMQKTTDEVEAMLANAKSRVKEIEKGAEERGYRAGHDKGREHGEREVTSLMIVLKKTVDSLQKSRSEFFAKSEKEMVDLVTLISSEIIQAEIKQNPEIIAGVLRKAVSAIHSKQAIKINVNPADLEIAMSLAEELIKETEAVMDVKFTADEKIPQGGCIVETNIGTLDATVENRLLMLHKGLREQVGG